MINVHFYGKLRAFASNPSPTADSKLELEYIPNETIQQLLNRIGIDPEQTGDLFINHQLAELDTPIPHDNARVAIFSKGMVLLDGGQHIKGHGYTLKKGRIAEYY